ncbi:hypothetical protein Pcinc_042454 [Petrolisthes cinctipes]|uniref:Uncharacterized protein n=1 Tax=Petrolisthes cinctipes TaxID=88211 RepID=A0AAE1BHH0_PETCI|nr:hypothetical protein Pcinc_042454 [Petrolisthes cinctipes]
MRREWTKELSERWKVEKIYRPDEVVVVVVRCGKWGRKKWGRKRESGEVNEGKRWGRKREGVEVNEGIKRWGRKRGGGEVNEEKRWGRKREGVEVNERKKWGRDGKESEKE